MTIFSLPLAVRVAALEVLRRRGGVVYATTRAVFLTPPTGQRYVRLGGPA